MCVLPIGHKPNRWVRITTIGIATTTIIISCSSSTTTTTIYYYLILFNGMEIFACMLPSVQDPGKRRRDNRIIRK